MLIFESFYEFDIYRYQIDIYKQPVAIAKLVNIQLIGQVTYCPTHIGDDGVIVVNLLLVVRVVWCGWPTRPGGGEDRGEPGATQVGPVGQGRRR